jgi:putative transposase
MPKKGHSEEQIITALKQYESGEKVTDICRKMGVSQAAFYTWKKQYAGMGVQELREMRQLREENGRLKRLVADLSLDRQILQEIVSKKLIKPRQRRRLARWAQEACLIGERRSAQIGSPGKHAGGYRFGPDRG